MRKEIFSYLNIAAQFAISSKEKHKRNFVHGVIGIRKDGTLVKSINAPTQSPNRTAHAEYRLCRKLDVGSIVYLARVYCDGSFALSKPCRSCENKLRATGVKRVYYTIGDKEFGILDL